MGQSSSSHSSLRSNSSSSGGGGGGIRFVRVGSLKSGNRREEPTLAQVMAKMKTMSKKHEHKGTHNDLD